MSCGDDARPGIYLDDSLFSYELVALLVAGGCRVVTPIDAGLLGARDAEHFAYAAQQLYYDDLVSEPVADDLALSRTTGA